MSADDTADLDTGLHNKPISEVDTRSMETGVRTGDRLGVYKLLEQIGEGGFGSVYLAEQTEPVRRRVAIKVLKVGSEAEHIVARFEAERQTLALMDHPNIAMILDAGQSGTGRPYFVMEYVQGSPITSYCDITNLNIQGRINLIRGVCHAVQHAHQKGIIHRDIKPNNVLVTIKDDAPVPKVIDFGIAKVSAGQSTDDNVYTKIHQMLGTPAYMSPEQAGGAPQGVDTRADVFSIGAMLYELLIGTTPLDNETISKLQILDLHNAIATQAAPSLIDRFEGLAERKTEIAAARSTTVANLRQAVKGDLNWIVQRCLEKDPTRRYPSVAALEEDLRRYLENEPVSAGAPSRLYLVKKFVRRHRIEVAGGCILAAVLALGFVGTVVGWARAADESARLQFTLEFFSESLAGATEASGPIANWSENPGLTLGEALANSQSLIGDTFTEEPELEATIRQLIGLAQLRSGKYDDAQLQLAKAYDIRSQRLDANNPRTLELLLPIAEARSKAGDIEGANQAAKNAYERHAEVFGKDSEITRSVAFWIARWFSSGFKFTDADRYFDLAALKVGGTSDTVDSITLASTIERVAANISSGELAKAENALRSAEPLIGRLPESESTLLQLFTRQIGLVLVYQGRAEEAIEYLTPAKSESDQPVDGVRTRLLAWAHGKAGDAESSDQLFQDLLESEHKNPGSPFREIFARIFYADVLLDHGRYEEAAKQADLAIERYDALGFPNDPDRLWGRAIAASAYIDLGRLDEAEWALAEAAEMLTLFPEHTLHVPMIIWAQAKLASLKGETESAKELIQQAIQQSLGIFGADHESTTAMQAWRDAL